MKTIAFIGGGSSKFVRELLLDLFTYERFHDARIVLMDIDPKRLALARKMLEKIIEIRQLKASVRATASQREALKGADYVFVSIMVGGFACYKADYEIPMKYGVLQGVSDTTGPGGLMRTLRTAPVLLKLAADVRELCPKAYILNYANPMPMNTKALFDGGHPLSVGLCHSMQGAGWTMRQWGLASDHTKVSFAGGGINHRNFFIELKDKGKDIYPAMRTAMKRLLAKHPTERTRLDLVRYLGALPAEGPMHQAEYYPWFMKDRKAAKEHNVEVGWGYRFDLELADYFHGKTMDIINGKDPLDHAHSPEYGARIVNALEGGEPIEFYGNVPNRGRLLEDFPEWAIVEVPCVASKKGIKPQRVGKIPLQLAAAMMPHVFLCEMGVNAVLSKDKNLLRQALQTDPLTSAILTLPRIEAMLDELLAFNKAYTKGWKLTVKNTT